MNPIDRMIDSVVACVKCSQRIGDCECWDDEASVAPRLKSRKWHRANPKPHAAVADTKPSVLFASKVGPK